MNRTKKYKKIVKNIIITLSLVLLVGILTVEPAFANYTGEIKSTLKQFVDIIGIIFQVVGVILGVFSVGQLVLAFKNDDADSKSRAGTMLAVAIVLIALPAIINGLGLVEKIG